jgi:putative membrane protein
MAQARRLIPLCGQESSMIIRSRMIAAASTLSLAVSASAYAADPAPADSAAAQATASPTDAAFLSKAVPAGREEVMAARGAIKMSKSARVKKTARLIYRDHWIANRNLAALAQRKGWTLPPPDAAAAVPTSFSDDEYIAGQIKAHQDAIALFTDEASSGSAPDLRAFAQGTLPALRHHLTALQALQSS